MTLAFFCGFIGMGLFEWRRIWRIRRLPRFDDQGFIDEINLPHALAPQVLAFRASAAKLMDIPKDVVGPDATFAQLRSWAPPFDRMVMTNLSEDYEEALRSCGRLSPENMSGMSTKSMRTLIVQLLAR